MRWRREIKEYEVMAGQQCVLVYAPSRRLALRIAMRKHSSIRTSGYRPVVRKIR